METVGRYKSLLKAVVITEDLLLLNSLYLLLLSFFPIITIEKDAYQLLLLSINLAYLLSLNFPAVTVDARKWKLNNIINRTFFHVGFTMLITIVFLFSTKTSEHVSRMFVSSYFILLFFLIIILHLLTHKILYQVFRTSRYHDKAVILGAGILGKELYKELTSDSYLGIKVMGFFDDDPSVNKERLLGNIADAKKYVIENNISKIYCTLPLSAKEKIKDILNFAEQHIINFHIIPSTRHYIDTPVILDMIGNTPILSIRKIPLSYSHNAYLKRALDLLVSSLFLAIIFPFMYLIIGIAIKISSPGPVFFTQLRTGKGGKNFKCYKFRSMRVNEECNTKQATVNDNRKTRVGSFLRRTNLDELPQFINVFKGDMSIVGPRPHMLFHTFHYAEVVSKYMVRHFIKPGITGLAQISGLRGETKDIRQMKKRIRKDILYIENWTLSMDIKIMIQTIWISLKGNINAY